MGLCKPPQLCTFCRPCKAEGIVHGPRGIRVPFAMLGISGLHPLPIMSLTSSPTSHTPPAPSAPATLAPSCSPKDPVPQCPLLNDSPMNNYNSQSLPVLPPNALQRVSGFCLFGLLICSKCLEHSQQTALGKYALNRMKSIAKWVSYGNKSCFGYFYNMKTTGLRGKVTLVTITCRFSFP